jgi:transcriptional repressor NrdR
MSDVAYVRFASVYRQFQSVSDFVATLEGLRDGLTRRNGSKRLAVVG